MSPSLSVTALTPAVGAEIAGVDLRDELSTETVETITRAWADHGVVIIRGQDITPDDQVRMTRHFGDLHERPRPKELRNESKRAEADPYDGYTMLVTNIREDGKPIGSLPDGEMMFHSDLSYLEDPARATLLYGVEVPSVGGDTLFASTATAYEALDDETKALLAGRKVLQGYLRGTTLRENNTAPQQFWHPIVRVIPETGRRALFVNRLMSLAVEGLEKAESDALLARLFDHIEHPDFVYAHKWQAGDLVIWDNRQVVHGRTHFDPGERRLLRRYATSGEAPVPA